MTKEDARRHREELNNSRSVVPDDIHLATMKPMTSAIADTVCKRFQVSIDHDEMPKGQNKVAAEGIYNGCPNPVMETSAQPVSQAFHESERKVNLVTLLPVSSRRHKTPCGLARLHKR